MKRSADRNNIATEVPARKTRGRPATGQSPRVTFRLPEPDLADLADLVEQHNRRRSYILRRFYRHAREALAAGLITL